MKDAVGGSLLLNIVVIFTSIIILFFVGIIAYTKAFKIKNRIIEVIETHGTYTTYEAGGGNTQDELTGDLSRAGYMTASAAQINSKCGSGNLNKVSSSGHLYCVYPKTNNEGHSYEVVTYIHFSFPVIGDMLTFPVRGETKVLGKEYNY